MGKTDNEKPRLALPVADSNYRIEGLRLLARMIARDYLKKQLGRKEDGIIPNTARKGSGKTSQTE